MSDIAIILRHSPYGTLYPQEILDIVLTASAFIEDISLIFIDDGVFQLKKQQAPEAIQRKNLAAMYQALPHYDIKKIFVDKESITQRNLTREDFILPVTLLTSQDLGELIAKHKTIMSF